MAFCHTAKGANSEIGRDSRYESWEVHDVTEQRNHRADQGDRIVGRHVGPMSLSQLREFIQER